MNKLMQLSLLFFLSINSLSLSFFGSGSSNKNTPPQPTHFQVDVNHNNHKPESQNPPLTINFNNNYTPQNQNTNVQKATATAVSSAQAKIDIKKDFLDATSINLKNIIYSYRWHIIFGSFTGMYTYTYSLMHQAKQLMNDKKRWVRWKLTVPSSQFIESSSAHITNNLITDIYIKYFNKENPKDTISPLVAFVRALEEEQLILKRYIRACNYMKKYKIQKLFPRYQNKYRLAKKRLVRLHLINRLFLTWSANQNIR